MNLRSSSMLASPLVRKYIIFLTYLRDVGSVPSLTHHILNRATESPEGALLCPGALLHLGSRAAVDQALSRLARKRELLRVCQGVYVRPIQTRFGSRPPAVDKVIASLSELWGETIVPCGGAAASALGLTTQVPVRSVYLTSGPNRKLTLGELMVEFRHAARWQLAAPHQPAGEAVRALSWLGSEEVEAGLKVIGGKLSPGDFQDLADMRAVMPAWMAELVSGMMADGRHTVSVTFP